MGPVAAFAALLVAVSLVQLASAQNYYGEKPGSCPPALPVQICSQACFSDSHCEGAGKCCPTNCGGTVCSRPVTMRNPGIPNQKPGTCPAAPTGRWVCTPTCRDDSDCRGTKKCCKNRCGALACQKPDIEFLESVEIPPSPGPLPAGNFENPNYNVYPYYAYNNA